MVDWGRAELSFRSDAKNVPGVFVLKANILIPEAGIVAMPSPSLSEIKYIPVREDLSTSCSYAQPFLHPPCKLLALAMLALLSPFFCHQKCRYCPDFGPFSGSFTSHHGQLAWPDPFSLSLFSPSLLMAIRSPDGAARHPISSPPTPFLVCPRLSPPTTFVRSSSATSLGQIVFEIFKGVPATPMSSTLTSPLKGCEI